ncbi:hypothetical protein, partial [Nonomuraea zeae]|uniref:hypothetical protein n=1 Tax=Nonomuraea zeae TaxID=1642303 RepID=UPI003612C7F5
LVGGGNTNIIPATMGSVTEDHLFERFVQVPGLEPVDRALYLSNLLWSVRETQAALGASLQAALAVVVETDLEAAAEAFGVPPATLVAMAREPQHPDVGLLRRGLQAIRRLPDLSAESICDVSDALHIDGATREEVRQIAELLRRMAEGNPLDGEVWADAPSSDRVSFQQAVTYARTLLPE